MKVTQALGLLVAGILLIAGLGSAFVLAKIDAADRSKTQAYDSSEALVANANEVSALARQEIAQLEGNLAGTGTADAVGATRVSFAAAVNATRAHIGGPGSKSANETARALDDLAAAEAALDLVATDRGDVEFATIRSAWSSDLTTIVDENARSIAVLTPFATGDPRIATLVHLIEREHRDQLEFDETLSIDLASAGAAARRGQVDSSPILPALVATLQEELRLVADRTDPILAQQLRDAADNVSVSGPVPDIEPLMSVAENEGVAQNWSGITTYTSALSQAITAQQAVAAKWPEYTRDAVALQRYGGGLLGAGVIGITLRSDRLMVLAQAAAVEQKTIGAQQLVDAKIAVAITVAIMMLPVAVVGTVIALRLRSRLREFDVAAHALRAGDISAPMPRVARDDFDNLASAWTSMVEALRQRDRDLASRNELVRQNERMASLGSLLAGVAHEVNNPLAFIKANEEMSITDVDDIMRHPTIQADAALGATLAQVAASMRINVDGIGRIERINRALKGFAAPSKEKREQVDMNDVVEGALIIAHNRLKNRFSIVRDYGELPKVVASPQEIGQIILNLVINAAQAAPDGTKIHIQTRADADHVLVIVKDEGPGVSIEMRPRLFQAFSTSKPTGTGLGLNISRQIAEAHGGTLDLADPERGGATFVLSIPTIPIALKQIPLQVIS